MDRGRSSRRRVYRAGATIKTDSYLLQPSTSARASRPFPADSLRLRLNQATWKSLVRKWRKRKFTKITIIFRLFHVILGPKKKLILLSFSFSIIF